MARKSWDLPHRSCWVALEISTLRTSPRIEVPLVCAYCEAVKEGGWDALSTKAGTQLPYASLCRSLALLLLRCTHSNFTSVHKGPIRHNLSGDNSFDPFKLQLMRIKGTNLLDRTCFKSLLHHFMAQGGKLLENHKSGLDWWSVQISFQVKLDWRFGKLLH